MFYYFLTRDGKEAIIMSERSLVEITLPKSLEEVARHKAECIKEAEASASPHEIVQEDDCVWIDVLALPRKLSLLQSTTGRKFAILKQRHQ